MADSDLLQNTTDIARLINGWLYRDTARWDELRALFHADGIIEIGWFQGRYADFIDASIAMHGRGAIRSRHLLASPLIQLRGDRAIAETAAILAASNDDLKLGFTGHTRFFDLVERRNGVWKLLKRNNIYDMCFFSFPSGPVNVDQKQLGNHPPEYAPLAYVLEASGHRVAATHPTRGSEGEAAIRRSGAEWLAGA